MENREKETFNYTYSGKQYDEIKAIRNKYMTPQEDKMSQLRRLDASVTKKASAVSLAIGIIGALILGFGMSLVMSDLNEMLGLQHSTAMLIGVIIGVVGIIPVCSAYPLYNYVVKIEKEKIAPEILRLTDELMK